MQDGCWRAVRDLLSATRVLHRKIESCLIDTCGVDAPGLRRVGEGRLQFHKLAEVGVVERIHLAEVAAGVELVEPNFPRGRDRKSTRLNSSHSQMSYADFCLRENLAGAGQAAGDGTRAPDPDRGELISLAHDSAARTHGTAFYAAPLAAANAPHHARTVLVA